MDTSLSWQDIALRLAAACIAGGLIGFDRTDRGKAAGLRTAILMCLGAAITMVTANLIFVHQGHSPDAQIRLDVLRFPLGVLSGVGFIGAGAILHRKDRIEGVTTAATMWLATIIGLALGAGQFILGAGATLLCLLVVWGLGWVERLMRRDREAAIHVVWTGSAVDDAELRCSLEASGFRVVGWAESWEDDGRKRDVRLDVRWRGREGAVLTPGLIRDLGARPGVLKAEWSPMGIES